MKPLETTVEEVLRKAIDSEVETRVYYQKLADRAATPEVRKRMLELADAELLHRAKMERKYREEVGKAPAEPETPKVDLPSDLVNVDMPRAAATRGSCRRAYAGEMSGSIPEAELVTASTGISPATRPELYGPSSFRIACVPWRTALVRSGFVGPRFAKVVPAAL